MAKIYTIQIGDVAYEVRAVDAAEACKKAIRAWQDGRARDPENPEGLTLTIAATEVPVVRRVE